LFLSPSRESYEPSSALGTLIGLPLTVLAIFLGVRVIAGEIDARRLEIAYTVPGGSHRVWLAKLAAAFAILLVAEGLLALVAWGFFTVFPLSTLYGALQAATVYLVLAMGLATLFKSEVTGAMVAAAVLALNWVLTGFGTNQIRFSPFWNGAALPDSQASQALAWTLQNRVGFLLVIAALVALAFGRAERREKMLSG
jgi:ABC-type transport system involved in multi-copper enzyme maturation permease subunit